MKPWGNYELIDDKICATKLLFIGKGKRTSLQIHKKRTEMLRLVHGAIKVQLENKDIIIDDSVDGGWIYIERGVMHRITALEDSKMIEVMFGEYEESDIVRIDDDYGRLENTGST